MWGCGVCGGVWLDHATSAWVLERGCQASVALSQRAAEHAQAPTEPTPHELTCPQCQQPMETVRIAQAWLDVDRCQQHGTWYDRGELERVARSQAQAADDWRNAPAPAPGVGAAGAAAGVAGGAAVGAMAYHHGAQHAAYAHQHDPGMYADHGYLAGGVDYETAVDVAEVAADVGGEVAVEASFGIVEVLLGILSS